MGECDIITLSYNNVGTSTQSRRGSDGGGNFAMNKSLFVLLLAAMAIALVGCSGDNGVNPSSKTDTTYGKLGVSSVVIGPSDIVFCMDVSDSISAGELESMVNGLGACLSDQSLIPADGRVSIVLVVYGDTIATVLGRTSVTPDNLQNAILPALQGLLADRVVAGGGFDLSGALDEALAILGASSVLDRHALVVGSGAADDAAAVETACTALANAGVMVSALAVGATDAGATLLNGCAVATGGFFGAGVSCGEALAYMLQVDIDLEPESAELSRGQEYTVTATVFRGGDPEAYPEAGLDVVIEIVAGPNAPAADTMATDTAGVASLTYTGVGGPGVDIIVATTVHPGTGMTLTDTVTATWLNAPPVCDAGGSHVIPLTTDTIGVQLDASKSSDADGDPLTFTWSAPCTGASFSDIHAVSPVVTLTGDCLCVDSLMVQLTVSDGFDSTMCEAAIRIDDLRPPIIVMREDPLVQWPPNHKYSTTTPGMLVMSVTDACGHPIDIASGLVIEVRSDEPDDATGDGKTINDIVVTCPNRVGLRSERMGSGNGRVYTIVYRYFTEEGVSADAEGYVVVPHDASGKKTVDDGDAYVVTPGCSDGRLTARHAR